ncbi:MAG: histidine kinase [Pseudomonadota bacterium]
MPLLYSLPMNTAPPQALPQPLWPATAQTVFLNVLVWTAISGVGAFGRYTDDAAQGAAGSYLGLWGKWCIEYLPMMLLSSGLCIALTRWPTLFQRKRNVAGVFIAVLLLFQPLQWFYIDWVRSGSDGGGINSTAGISLEGARQVLLRMRRFGWFMSSATFAVIVAIGNWRLAKAREQAWQRTHTENLQLSLALEQQRMLALRAQFEPHFIFNALNAISALVRSGDKAVSLKGINRLSDLLRYALSASLRDAVTIGEELQFVQDYLDLQRLRYGDRLQIHIDGDEELLHSAQCPPLLLQPLIENALRHDLDCHQGRSDIRVSFERQAADLLITVSNPVNAHAPPNPGTGLGLQNTRARLLMSSPSASLRTERRADRFFAEIRLPLAQGD